MKCLAQGHTTEFYTHKISISGSMIGAIIDPDIRKFYELKIEIIFLPINLNMCFGCSKEWSHGDRSFEYPQHMFWMRNKENRFPIHTFIRRPDLW